LGFLSKSIRERVFLALFRMDESTHSYIITFSPLFVCAGEVGEEPSLHGDTLLLQFSFLFYLSYGRGDDLLLCGRHLSGKGDCFYVYQRR
jgi:hypothetical protein